MTSMPHGTPATPVTGVVEALDGEGARGWLAVEPGAEPVRVGVHVDGHEVAVGFAGEAVDRHVGGEARGFSVALADLWDFVGRGNRVSVHAAGQALPIAGQGTVHVPVTDGGRDLADLRHRLAAGEVFDRSGRLQLSKTLDTAWQAGVLDLYDRLRRHLAGEGHDLVLAYGTLLGAVREGGFIGHDLDFDAAFVSRHRDAAAAARDLRRLAFELIDAGFGVSARPTSLTVTDLERPGVLIQLFHLYVDESGTLQFPHGIAGQGNIGAWEATTEIDFADGKALVPAGAEQVLEHVYGTDWRTPNPAFSWASERTAQAVDGFLPAAVVEEIYWAGFYARTTYTTGSTFQQLVQSRADVPGTIVDIGCGDGRDSYAFAAAGRPKVTGLDRSHVGVRQAARKAEQLGYAGLGFTACDVGDAPKLRATLRGARSGDEPMTFYLRFFLHSIPEDVQRTLLGVVAECSRPGDYFAAEFRTDRDEAAAKVHGNHYRRFQNGAAFGRALRETYGFTPLLEQEGNGFSPYKGEDPYLYRVIGRRG